MPIIEWSGELSVGVGSIDRQHQHLIDLINAIQGALEESDPLPHIDRVLKELVEYVACHFEEEERMMTAAAYPETERHRRSHAALSARVMEMVGDFEGNPQPDMARELFEFLSGWLVNHIKGEDVPLRAWVEEDPADE